MRIALLADVHGNSLALNAVLEDIETQGGVDEYWFLGDYVAIGPDPVGVLRRLSALTKARFIRGNTDRYVAHSPDPWPIEEEERQSLDLLRRAVEVARSFAWTTGAVAASGWLPWLAELPLDFRETLPDGARVLAVHASPGTDDGSGINPTLEEEPARALLADANADLVLVGHVHAPLDRIVDVVRLVNPGSVSNPVPPDLRASYALLVATSESYEIYPKRVEYDRQEVVRQAFEVNHPSAQHIAEYMRGAIRPFWVE